MDIKESVRHELRAISEHIIDLSHRIHASPELGFEEHQAVTWTTDLLAAAGFDVEVGICDLSTAFRARVGNGPLHIVFCAEYDALPVIGHACGHNIIAATAVGAGAAAAKVADDLGLTVTVLGTPGEEAGNAGGKILLLERGAFEGVDVAMMVHPAPFDALAPSIIAASMFDVHYTGKEAHAAAFPELGVNAADALTIAQTAIGLLRQHIRPTDRIHGIVTHGGEAPNIVPGFTSARYMVRATELRELDELRGRVHRCFDAGALATGAQLDIIGGDRPYAEMRHDAVIGAAYRRNSERLGRSFAPPSPAVVRMAASTDMGNVSLRIPAIHPSIGIDSWPAVNHQREFAAHCVTPTADRAVLDGALAMAWTAIDVARDEVTRKHVQGLARGSAEAG